VAGTHGLPARDRGDIVRAEQATRSPLPAQSTEQAVLGIVRKHFLHGVSLARRFQEAQLDLGLAHVLAPAQLVNEAARRAAHDKLLKLDIIVRENRGHYRQLLSAFDADLAALPSGKPVARPKSPVHQLIAIVQQRAIEQAQALRLRDEWAQSARDVLALIEQHVERIQFDADGPVFEDPELVEQWARLNDRMAQVTAREADVAAQHRLRMLESAQRLDVRLA
jgi:hypothetical protein